MKKLPYIFLIEDNEQDEILTIKALQKNSILNDGNRKQADNQMI